MTKCKVFSFVDDLETVVENGLYMRAVVGDGLSIGIVKFVAEAGAGIAPKAHAHGEEVTLQITGGCDVLLGDTVAEGNPKVRLDGGRLMIMAPEQAHYGINSFAPEGMSLRFNVVTPPRQEFGAKGRETTYYPRQDKP